MDNLQETLAQLRDIHEPLAPGIWPLAPGWWILGVLVFVAFAVLVWLAVRELNRRRPYTGLKSKVRTLNKLRLEDELTPIQYATAINLAYKELLVTIEERSEASRLHGSDWLDYLSERFNDVDFNSGAGRSLGAARYLPGSFSDEGLTELVDRTLLRAKYESWKRPGSESG